MDVLIRGADVISDVAWEAGRDDTQRVLDALALTIGSAGALAGTFLGPLAMLFGMIGLLVMAVVLFMRSALLYLVAAFAPIVWASAVSPVMRGSGRRLVHVTVALVLAKPAITISLVVGTKLMASAGDTWARRCDRRRSSCARHVGDRVRLLRDRWTVAVGCVPVAAVGRAGRSVVGNRWRLGPIGDDRSAGRADGQVARRDLGGVCCDSGGSARWRAGWRRCCGSRIGVR